MKSAEEWKSERWEGQDFIVTGFGIQHPGVFSKHEADLIVATLRSATPLIQLDSWKQGMTDAANLTIGTTYVMVEDILEKRDETKSV